VLEEISPVEVIGIEMWKTTDNTPDGSRTDGHEPDIGGLDRQMIARGFGILVLLIFLLEDHCLLPAGFSVWRKTMILQFILGSFTLKTSIALDT
jgi:hypothetical protein